VMFYLYKSEVLKWPEINGKPSLKLEYLNSENNLVVGDAHDALVDVKATLELARKLHKETEMWEYLQTYFDKSTDEDRMLKLSEAILVDGSYGFDNFYQIPVLQLGQHNHYKNQTLWLRLDVPVPEKIYVIRKRAGDLGLLLPTKERFTKFLSAERQQMITANKEWIAANPGQFEEIVAQQKDYKYPIVPNVDIDAALYQIGFPSDHDQKLCNQFHREDLNGKVGMVDKFSAKLRTQAIRILGRNYPLKLSDNLQDEFNGYLNNLNQEVDYKNQLRYSHTQAENDLNELFKGDLSQQQQNLLQSLVTYSHKHLVSDKAHTKMSSGVYK
jgi:exodeoxyribonuclease I